MADGQEPQRRVPLKASPRPLVAKPRPNFLDKPSSGLLRITSSAEPAPLSSEPLWSRSLGLVLAWWPVFIFPLFVLCSMAYDAIRGEERPSRTYDTEYVDDYIYRPATSGRHTISRSGSQDLDCVDIGEEIWVGTDDPHGLDGDGDGWGCEGW